MATNGGTSSEAATPRLGPRGKIVIPEAFTKSKSNGLSEIVAPASERTSRENGVSSSSSSSSSLAPPVEPAAAPPTVLAAAPAPAPAKAAAVAVSPKGGSPALKFNPISPGLSNIKLPLGPSPMDESAPSKKVKEEPPVEAKVGDLVELFMGRGQVRAIREEDGMLEVWAMGWEMAGEQRPRYFVQREAVKVVKTVYYQMPVLERLQIAAWLKMEGTRLFKAGDHDAAAQNYMKAIGVLKTCEFKTNAQNARALELMIPCHNNAATCYIKRKNYGDARLLSENVDTLCSALARNKDGMVMKALKERGVGETTILGQWWCNGLHRCGKACLNLGENEEAVKCFRKGIKLAKPAALAKVRAEIKNQLEIATKRLASQTKKAQKMWTKAFSKNSTDTTATDEASGSAGGDVAGSSAGKKGKALPSIPIPTPRTSMNGMNGINRGINGPIAGSGAPQKTVLEQLEELTKMGGVPAIPRSAVKQQKNKEEEEEEEEGSEDGSEEEYDEDEEGDDESLSLSSGLLWGSVAIGAVAVSVAALMALGKRR